MRYTQLGFFHHYLYFLKILVGKITIYSTRLGARIPITIERRSHAK